MGSWRVGVAALLFLAATAVASPEGKAGAAGEVPVTGKADPRLASIDRMMTAFLARHKLPGAAVAVARHGRVVYARGFGYADVGAREPVEPGSLFRIASLSKPLTAAAVLQLADRRRLRLDEQVFGLLGLDEPSGPKVSFDPRWKKVTVLDLLHHTGGWDRDRACDPMFVSEDVVRALKVPAPARPDDIIRYMLRKPLQFDPGTRYCYSNFGYCLLGRVIEKAGGRPYEDYVRKEVLAPLGVTRAHLGHTLPEGRARGEVKYYARGKERTAPAVMGPDRGKPVPTPYGSWCLESLDAHGGWIASAPALVRFGAAFEDPAACKVLSSTAVGQMFAPPMGPAGYRKNGKPKDHYYGCGWDIVLVEGGRFSYFHGGYLDGSSTTLVHRHDGIAWAILFNGTTDSKEAPADAVDSLMHQAVDAVKEWPGGSE